MTARIERGDVSDEELAALLDRIESEGTAPAPTPLDETLANVFGQLNDLAKGIAADAQLDQNWNDAVKRWDDFMGKQLGRKK